MKLTVTVKICLHTNYIFTENVHKKNFFYLFFFLTGKRRKVYDPDYEHVEASKFKEYERLEGDGYDETLKDPDSGKLRHIHAPGLGHDPRTPRTMKTYNETESTKYTTSDYVVPPKVPQLQMGPGIGM